MSRRGATGVLLMTFGSAVTSADVPAYLRSVRGGREPSAELVAEFERRFDVIGRSPLIDITLEQAAALQRLLDERDGEGSYVVAAGMLHSAPSVASSLERLAAAEVERVIGVVLAPQYSPLILSGYERAVAAGSTPGVPVRIAGAWNVTPSWVATLSGSLGEALHRLESARCGPVAVVFTAHSLPRPVLERDPQYMEQIDATIDAVAREAGLARGDWSFAFQSAGHSPAEWLKPDLVDVLPTLRERGAAEVLVAPVQFVSDHLEILYDIDVAAAAQASAAGLGFHRIAMPNATPRFIAALAEVIDREMAAIAA